MIPGEWFDKVLSIYSHQDNHEWDNRATGNGNLSLVCKHCGVDASTLEAMKACPGKVSGTLSWLNDDVWDDVMRNLKKYERKCTCGAASLGYSSHSTWCDKHGEE